MSCQSKTTMEKLIILLMGLLTGGWIHAQTKINGTVKDNRGHIIIGASVAVKGSYDGGVSDSSGRFSFKTFEKGAQVVVATNIGYKTVEQPVTIVFHTPG